MRPLGVIGVAPRLGDLAHLIERRVSPNRPSATTSRSLRCQYEVTPVRWTVNGFRDGHWTTGEGDREIAPPWSIVDPEGTGRSPIPEVRSYIMGER